jgi:hypothetical protein
VPGIDGAHSQKPVGAELRTALAICRPWTARSAAASHRSRSVYSIAQFRSQPAGW